MILVVVVALLIKYNIVSKDTVLFWTNKTIDWAWDYIAKNGDNIKKWIKDWFEKAVDETWKIIDNPKETLDNINTTLSTISSNSLWETNIKSFNRAKKVLERNVYNGKHKTFYCGCEFEWDVVNQSSCWLYPTIGNNLQSTACTAFALELVSYWCVLPCYLLCS